MNQTNSTSHANPEPAGRFPQVQGEVCIANISPSERRRRLIGGIIPFVLAIAILAGLMWAGVDRFWRLPLFLLFWGSTIGFFQWNDKTCVGLARTGTRKLTDQAEQIEDPAELAQVQRQARRVNIKAFVAAIPLTFIVLVLPS